MVTRKEVAVRAGVSEATVSNVLNGKSCVLPDKVDRVYKAMRELGYIPNQNARNLVTGRSNHIGIAIYEMTNPYHMEIAQYIERYASKQGYIVSLFLLDNNMQNKLNAIAQRRLDGVVNFMTNEYPDQFIEELTRYGAVMINFNESIGSMFVNRYEEAMKQLMERAFALGHRKIAYLTSQDSVGFSRDGRGLQWFASLKELPFEKAKVFYNSDFGLMSDKIGYQLAKEMIADDADITAVFCTNDLTAFGCIRALTEAGLRVPEDISVIGCDDIRMSELMMPPLTTIAIDKKQQGEDIARQAIGEILGETGRVRKEYVAYPVYRASLTKCRNGG